MKNEIFDAGSHFEVQFVQTEEEEEEETEEQEETENKKEEEKKETNMNDENKKEDNENPWEQPSTGLQVNKKKTERFIHSFMFVLFFFNS